MPIAGVCLNKEIKNYKRNENDEQRKKEQLYAKREFPYVGDKKP